MKRYKVQYDLLSRAIIMTNDIREARSVARKHKALVWDYAAKCVVYRG